mmetsp:Transcript_10022/g.30819  ORF Transcript_10022/g.30819 Transcript_10022/m.30819 type:complete len:633 (-) Transcript_10022:60-1958(-)
MTDETTDTAISSFYSNRKGELGEYDEEANDQLLALLRRSAEKEGAPSTGADPSIPPAAASAASTAAAAPLPMTAAQAVAELLFASAAGDLQRVQALVSDERVPVSADSTDYDKRSALHLAASENHINVVNYLLAQGASPNARDRWNKTPLQDAIAFQHKEVIAVLKANGGTICEDQFDSANALCVAAKTADLNKIKTLSLSGINLNAADYDQRTALHIAASDGKEEVVKLLLLLGAAANPKDRWGETPLTEALKNQHPKVVRLLAMYVDEDEVERATKAAREATKANTSHSTSSASAAAAASTSSKKTSKRKGKKKHGSSKGDDHTQPESPAGSFDLDLVRLVRNEKKVLGEGSWGKVYRGTYDGKPVAIKEMQLLSPVPNLNQTDKQERRKKIAVKLFHRESLVLQKLSHPNIVGLVGVSMSGTSLLIVEELVIGRSLYDHLHDRSMWPKSLIDVLKNFFAMALQIARGMEHVHHVGVIHRDLKSPNILYEASTNRLVIIDFGLAHIQKKDDIMTKEAGTLRWMAPEMIRRLDYDQSVDVYSFGILMFELLTGDLPYKHYTPLQAGFAVCERKVRPTLPEWTPVALENLIRLCWHQDAPRRPPFAKVVKTLESLVDCKPEKRAGFFSKLFG